MLLLLRWRRLRIEVFRKSRKKQKCAEHQNSNRATKSEQQTTFYLRSAKWTLLLLSQDVKIMIIAKKLLSQSEANIFLAKLPNLGRSGNRHEIQLSKNSCLEFLRRLSLSDRCHFFRATSDVLHGRFEMMKLVQ